MKAEREHEYYQVFARRKADEPMLHVGTVGASEPDDAEVFAFKLYDQWRWTEMFVAPSAVADRGQEARMSRYLVFARSRYEEPLELHGDLEADDDEAAAAAAPDDKELIEIQLVPEAAIRWVVQRG